MFGGTALGVKGAIMEEMYRRMLMLERRLSNAAGALKGKDRMHKAGMLWMKWCKWWVRVGKHAKMLGEA
jgi:hypothetical protein